MKNINLFLSNYIKIELKVFFELGTLQIKKEVNIFSKYYVLTCQYLQVGITIVFINKIVMSVKMLN